LGTRSLSVKASAELSQSASALAWPALEWGSMLVLVSLSL
jgi:hypothetical protein